MASGAGAGESIRWERTGDLYWLGYTLMRLLHVLQQPDPDGATVIHGLQQARRHAAQLNLDESIINRLESLREEAAGVAEWTVLDRNTITLDVGAIVELVADLAERQQGDFGRNSAV